MPDAWRHGDTADVEKVNEFANTGQRRGVLEAEAGEQGFEGHAGLDMSERGAVEVEAQPLGCPIGGLLEPAKGRLGIDVAANQPGACEPVDPGPPPGRPHPGSVVRCELSRLIALAMPRGAPRDCSGAPRPPAIPRAQLGTRSLRRRGNVIRLDDLCVSAPQSLQSAGAMRWRPLARIGGLHFIDQRTIVVGAIEEGPPRNRLFLEHRPRAPKSQPPFTPAPSTTSCAWVVKASCAAGVSGSR